MHNTIIVGIDGSPGAEHALRWALDEAARRDAKVVAVHAFDAKGPAGLYSGAVFDQGSIEQAGQAVLDEVVGAVDPEDSADVERRCVDGQAASVLIEAGQDADLVVVGSRGLGGFSRLMLGSVSSQVAHHAPCPVVVVPTPT